MRTTERPGKRDDTVAWVVLAIIAVSLALAFEDSIVRLLFGGSP